MPLTYEEARVILADPDATPHDWFEAFNRSDRPSDSDEVKWFGGASLCEALATNPAFEMGMLIDPGRLLPVMRRMTREAYTALLRRRIDGRTLGAMVLPYDHPVVVQRQCEGSPSPFRDVGTLLQSYMQSHVNATRPKVEHLRWHSTTWVLVERIRSEIVAADPSFALPPYPAPAAFAMVSAWAAPWPPPATLSAGHKEP